jgi:hypothetical protein
MQEVIGPRLRPFVDHWPLVACGIYDRMLPRLWPNWRLERLLVAFPDVLVYTCLRSVRKALLPLEEWELFYGETFNDGTKFS